jgi:uncharacterized iron-regulated protein
MVSRCRWFRFIFAVPFILLPGGNAQEPRGIQALDLDKPLAIESVITQLATKRVVFVGETHSRYDHHLNQLEVIRQLHQLDGNLVIGVEYFQQQLQPKVDDYIAGRTTEDEFLRAVDYYRTWGYDYRLYAPIFRFAREQKIPIRALNIPSSLASATAKVGIKGLSEEQRAALPRDIGPADEAYRGRLRAAFEGHHTAGPADFDHFVEAQLAWDESMANNAADYLKANPGCRMVILAGAGHIAFGSGIPSRLERRIHSSYAIVLSSGENIEPQIADYILLSREEQLPPAGTLGASLEEEGGLCRIRSLDPAGAADEAGLKKGDVLVALDGQPVKTTGDVRVALWDKKPGQHVVVEVRRGRWLANTEHKFDVELAAPGKGFVKPGAARP